PPQVRFSFAPIQTAVGGPTTLFVVGDFASTTGETFGVRLPATHPFGVDGSVVALHENPGPRALGYLGVIPATPRVDGGFDEWTAASADTTNDVTPRGNRNIDLTHYAGRSVSVYIGPDNRPPVLGDDAIRMFLDIDNSTFSGYSIGGIGADRLVELRGKDGTVTQSALLAFAGSFPGQWAWTPVAPVT